MNRKLKFIFFLILFIPGLSYSQFTLLDSDQTSIKFSNEINETETINILKFDYLYNGGGVGIIDVNNDGLDDIFFTGNFVDDKLYLNKGNFKFKDVTAEFGINSNGWSTGVCIFDVNNDGFNDIYVCRSGIDGIMEGTTNVLYINNGGKSFTESAEKYGLDIKNNTVQAAPLDFDLDGDLDLYLICHPGSFKHTEDFSTYYNKIIKGEINSDLLLENVDGKYKDITQQAGIFEYGYSLGIAITDLNLDRYPDIIVSNDFDEPDHVFINQQNGRFNDESLQYLKHTSNYSMGNDVGDFNNDGLLDYISLDMAFQSSKRSKLNMASMNPTKFWTRVKLGWNHQYMHNMLQLNSGFNSFKEIAYLANVAKTDWSWAPLFMDINADGWQDIIVSNGYKRDTKNNDIKAMLDDYLESAGNNVSILEFLDLIPSTKVKNQLFLNQKDLSFSNRSDQHGLDLPVNSNGMAYSDLNNDGLLDLIINNVDTTAFIYRNNLGKEHNVVTIDFSDMRIKDWIGAKIRFETKQTLQSKEAYFIRGFQSSVTHKQMFYWESSDIPEKIKVELNNGKTASFEVSKTIVIKPVISDFVESKSLRTETESTLFRKLPVDNIDFTHVENEFDDFEKESLLPHRLSQNGPVIKVGDFNNDELDDIIVGSSVGEIPSVYLQTKNSQFQLIENPAFFNNQLSEEEDIYITDINNDGNKDIIFSYGGYQYPEHDENLKSSIYLGNGEGKFGKVQNNKIFEDKGYNSGKILVHDFNRDGHPDFLICGKSKPLTYPLAGRTSILMNNRGYFQDFTKVLAPEIERIGIVQDALITDADGDGDEDIIIVGEWMDFTVFLNNKGRFTLHQQDFGLQGWWNRVIKYDFDGDGDDDFLVGNAGTNNKFNPSSFSPLNIYMNDFDENSTNDIVISVTNNQIELPLRGKECSAGQMPFIDKKFKTYESFASSNLSEIYSNEKLDSAYHLRAVEFRSGVIENKGDLNFRFHPFGNLAQVSALTDFELMDVNEDGKMDIIGIGNDYTTEVETTRNDAGTGIVLLGEGGFRFSPLSGLQSGMHINGDARCIEKIKLASGKNAVIIGVNAGKLQIFEFAGGQM